MKHLNERVEQALEQNLFSACAVAVFEQNHRACFYQGHHSQDKKIAVGAQSVFDLASLTKVLATGSYLADCFERKILHVDQLMVSDVDKECTLLQDLMRHQAGYAAWCDFKVLAKNRLENLHDAILSCPKTYDAQAQSVYSDIGFSVMMYLLEDNLKTPWKDQVQGFLDREEAFKGIFFASERTDKNLEDYVATEQVSHRNTLASVHDENCHFMGGVGAHAGAFATLDACVDAGQAWLKAVQGQSQWISQDLAQTMIQGRKADDGSVRALCWDKPSVVDGVSGSTAGQYISAQGFGHLGYTGTSIWIDPAKDQGVIVLANRVHPKDEHTLEFRQFRKDIHNLVWGEK